jgi:hypothetical protein
MTFKQYTSCIDAVSFTTLNQYWQSTLAALATGGILAVIPSLVSPWCDVFLIPIMAALWIMVYCQWFLHGRLICLPGPGSKDPSGGSDQIAIGLLIDVDPPGNKAFFDSIDTDYSIGILLAPNPLEATSDQQHVEESVPYGFLVRNQPPVIDLGVPFTGHQGTDLLTGTTVEVLHCEFEGAGVRDLLLAARIAFALAVAALMVCLFVPGPVGFIIALLLGLLSLLGDYVGVRVGQDDQANPADENPSLGELHPGVDMLVVFGSWVYDSGHNVTGGGWNEIHPIKSCEVMGKWTGEWPVNINDLDARWSVILGQTTSPVTLENQKHPQNQWQVHPVLDGCQPSVIV